MINRYSRPEMANIWTEENKYKAWLEVEILADEAWAELGGIPQGGPASEGGGPGVVNGRVLGENGDALLALEVTGVHDALAGLFDRVALRERSGLPEHCVNQRGLAMIDVCDDRDVSQVGTRGHMWAPHMWTPIIACDGAQKPA